MDLNALIEYISSLNIIPTKYSGLDEKSLGVYEHFAWKKPLSAYQIWSNIKSTYLKMAYKNVNKRTNTLLSSGLIQETKVIDTNKRRAKYYQLTEYGIYQLFLKKLNSLLIRQLDTIRDGELPTSNALTFFYNYNNSVLFETFLYPYFNRDTLFAIGDIILEPLYHYLSSCCGSIEKCLKLSKIPVNAFEFIFSLNKVPGEHNELLLSHLKQIFNLENIDECEIKREDTSITVRTSSSASPILIRPDKDRNKVLVMSTVGGQYKEFEYDATTLGQETMVHRGRHVEESLLKNIVNDAEKQIEQLIYEFVYDLASSTTETSQEFSYYFKILSQDDKFMRVVEKIHQDRHKGFETGYKKLRNVS